MLCENRLNDLAASLHMMLTWAEGHVARAHGHHRRTQSYALTCWFSLSLFMRVCVSPYEHNEHVETYS